VISSCPWAVKQSLLTDAAWPHTLPTYITVLHIIIIIIINSISIIIIVRLASIHCIAPIAVNNFQAPIYLQELVQHVNETVSRSNLCSTDTNTFIKSRTWTKFAEQAFSFAGPAVRNALPAKLRSIKSKDTFKRHLKTHYFKLAF